MLRKVITIMMTVALVVSLAGCGNDSQPSAEPTGDATITATPGTTPGTDSATGVNELYQLTDSGQMMSYILKTKNGKLIVLDGGYAHNGNDIVKLAKELTGQKVPEIEAWFFSHPHSDHVNAFTELMTEEDPNVEDKLIPEEDPLLTVKHIYYNFPSLDFVREHEETSVATYENFMIATTLYKGDDKTTIVQSGDQFTVDDVLIEVLVVPDETAPFTKGTAVNEASVIYRMTIDGQRVLFLGDAYQQTGIRLRKAYREDLTCDIVQMAHHGSQGVQEALYKLLDAKACLWPTPQWLWDNVGDEGPGTGPYETVQLYQYMRDDLGIKHHYVAKDGVQKLVFPLDLS